MEVNKTILDQIAQAAETAGVGGEWGTADLKQERAVAAFVSGPDEFFKDAESNAEGVAAYISGDGEIAGIDKGRFGNVTAFLKRGTDDFVIALDVHTLLNALESEYGKGFPVWVNVFEMAVREFGSGIGEAILFCGVAENSSIGKIFLEICVSFSTIAYSKMRDVEPDAAHQVLKAVRAIPATDRVLAYGAGVIVARKANSADPNDPRRRVVEGLALIVAQSSIHMGLLGRMIHTRWMGSEGCKASSFIDLCLYDAGFSINEGGFGGENVDS